MIKNSTLIYRINNLSSKVHTEITSSDSLFDFEDEFEDVITNLGTLEEDVDQKVVDRILNFTFNYS